MNDRGLRERLDHLVQAPVLFAILALLVLVIIWAATLHIIAVERNNAERTARETSAELAGTYEAQTVRAVREISQTLKLVGHALESNARPVLPALEASELLPPGLLFAVAIADEDGTVIEQTRSLPGENVAHLDIFEQQCATDQLLVGLPWPDRDSGITWLPFSSKISTEDGSFSGVVLVAVDASYFVSGYDHSRLGDHGVIGLLGTDDIFRVRRSGDRIYFGEEANHQSLAGHAESGEIATVLTESDWDGVERYVSSITLYDFPLAVVVGISRNERLAAIAGNIQTYLARATVASVAALLLFGMLGYLSWQLQRSRTHARRTQSAHAREIEHLVSHDSLTGLPNRNYFSHELGNWIKRMQLDSRRLAVVFLDIDRFKVINDTLGHEAGDRLLVIIGKRINAVLEADDFIARFGGDEFIIVIPMIDHQRSLSGIANRMLKAIAEPCDLNGREIRPSASVGISIFPEDGEDEQTLIKNADIAMYHAKSEGRSNFQYYSAHLEEGSLDRLTLETALAQALERKEFVLFYQARFDLRKNRVTGVEALLRWRPPVGEMVPSMRFIPLAEETGQIVPIGNWVLREACRQSVAWREQGLPSLVMAVNLSARQFMDDQLPDMITGILDETGMDPKMLELEITESMLMHDSQQSVQMLNQLRERGIRVAVDDFGTGYSSLSNLKSFPVDTIKIDGLFIRDVIKNIEDRSLTEAIITVGRALDLTIVAEGVETREQLNFLRAERCDEVQGYYINRPVPADQFSQFEIERQSGSSGAK